MNNKILVVEDDKDINSFLREILSENGYSVLGAYDGAKGLELARKTMPDLVLLDLTLPKIDGETVCREIKKTMPETIVIILSARDKTPDIVQGFDLGADDYVSKPFVADELLARIKKRLGSGKNSVISIEDLELNNDSFEVKRGGKNIKLTPTEFNLLKYLMLHKGRILTREMILNKVWMSSPEVETRVVDVYMGYLRKKIDNGRSNKLIISQRGFGYGIKAD